MTVPSNVPVEWGGETHWFHGSRKVTSRTSSELGTALRPPEPPAPMVRPIVPATAVELRRIFWGLVAACFVCIVLTMAVGLFIRSIAIPLALLSGYAFLRMLRIMVRALRHRPDFADASRRLAAASDDQERERVRVQGRDRTAHERWDMAFYCGRCDRVYVPGESWSVSVRDFAKLLYPG